MSLFTFGPRVLGSLGRTTPTSRRRYATTSPLPNPSAKNSPQITTLSNGLKVSSSHVPGHFQCFGVFVDAGSQVELSGTEGCSHLMDRMAFKSTKHFSSQKLVAEFEGLGGNFLTQSSRDTIVYQGSVFNKDLEKSVELFASMVRHPLFKQEELEDVRQSTLYELDMLSRTPEVFMGEILHQVAFGGKLITSVKEKLQPLARSQQISADALESVTPDSLFKYHKSWYTPNRITLAGVGMTHEKILHLAQHHFGDWSPVDPDLQKYQATAIAPTRYTGGYHIVDTTDESGKAPVPHNPDDAILTHVQIAFEAPGIFDPDIYALATLTSLMGGGGSFSAGGPGKGMYSNLYTEVLNRHHWVDQCHMVHYPYRDTGLLCIAASIHPSTQAHSNILPVLMDRFVSITQAINPVALSRAKAQLKSNILMGLESKMVQLDDLGRQVLAQGYRLEGMEMCQRIDSITQADVCRVASRIVLGHNISSPYSYPGSKPWKRSGTGAPTVLIHGPLSLGDGMGRKRWTGNVTGGLKDAQKVMEAWGFPSPVL